jgi:hypothetical protein
MKWRVVTFLLGLALVLSACMGDPVTAPPTVPQRCQELGPWSTWPEADWVRAIVKRGGYDVVGETGSAVVASGKGHEFSIWATEGRAKRVPNTRRLATVRGVPIHGDRDVWRYWHARGFTFWVHGASATPSAGRLAPVVDASLRLPFRDPCQV